MDLKSFPTVSEKIYLSDISGDFAKAEGAVDRDQQAWVIVRQAREEDHIKRAALQAKREIKYGATGPFTMSEIVEDNPRERVQYEVYWTLVETGNLSDDGKPLFAKSPVNQVPFAEFEKVWGAMPPVVAQAIH